MENPRYQKLVTKKRFDAVDGIQLPVAKRTKVVRGAH